MATTRYLHLEIDSPKPPPTPDEIAAIEAGVGEELTPDLLAFLAVANGGKLDYTFDLPTEAGPFPLCFYSLYSTRLPLPGRARAGVLLDELEAERRLKGLRRGLLPIAGDGGTSVLFVDLAAERRGQVVAYVEGLPGWDGTTEGCFVELAKSFPLYVSRLYLNTVDEPRRGG